MRVEFRVEDIWGLILRGEAVEMAGERSFSGEDGSGYIGLGF